MDRVQVQSGYRWGKIVVGRQMECSLRLTKSPIRIVRK